jgi:hypothetical protein
MKRHTNSGAIAPTHRTLSVRAKAICVPLAYILAVLCLLLRPEAIHAATAVWIGPATGGDFQTPANWTTGAVPTTLDLALFGGVNGSITYTADAATDQTFFTGANVTTTLALGAGQTHSTLRLLLIGSGGLNQDVVIPSGTVKAGTIFFIGSEVGASDTDVTISGPTTVVQSGTADNAAAIFLGVGANNATLTIKEGATFAYNGASNGLVAVGLQGTSNGVLTVTDPGSSLTTIGALQVGSNNDVGKPDMLNNQAKVLNGATLTARVMQVGILATGKQNTTTVSGAGSKMNLTGIGAEAPIGWRSINNSLVVENGGLIDGGNRFVMGIEATSTGNSTTIASGGRVNGTGFETRRGTLTITEGSIYLKQYLDVKVVADPLDDEWVGGSFVSNVGANGFVNFNSGTVEAVSADFNKALTVGDGGANSATYRMVKGQLGANGLHAFTGGLVLSSNAILEGSGDISGSVSGSAGAQVNVGTSPGLIKAGNDWANTGLSVALEVGNLATLPAFGGLAWDEIDVAGAFTHGGSVAIDVSGFVAGSGFVKDLKLIGWGSEVGSTAATAVSFVGGPALPYEFRSDGLYLTNVAYSFVPEPSTLALVVSLLGLGCVQRRRVTAIC